MRINPVLFTCYNVLSLNIKINDKGAYSEITMSQEIGQSVERNTDKWYK
jgi:hypothetical protein